MEDDHLTPDLLAAVVEGRLPPAVLTRRLWRHHLAVCPACRAAVAAFQRSRPSRRDRQAYADAIAKVKASLGSPPPEEPPEKRVVERDLAALLALPAGRRVAKVERARKRFRSPTLTEALLEEAGKHLPGEPREALDLVRTARSILYRCRDFHQAPELWTRVLAYLGNALRAAEGDLQGAETHFLEARHFLDAFELADPLLEAELDSLEASLRRDQRRFTEAEALLRRATRLYRRLGEEVARARCLLKLSTLCYDQADPARAAEVVRQALALLDPAEEPRLAWCAAHSLAVYLCDAGRPAEARAVLAEHRRLYDRFPDAWSRLRRQWLAGKIAAGLGEEPAAEAAFVTAQEGFLAEGQWYDAALVSLDLAALYAARGRSGELKSLAEELVPLFESHEVHREALAALLLFRRAAREEVVTVAAVRRLAANLERLRRGGAGQTGEPS